jgi:hypothetical protein
LDETIREKLLSRFATYLDSVDRDETGEPPAMAEGSEEADLFSVFVELAGLRNEVRTESRLVKEALDRFHRVFDTLQSSHETLEQQLKRARAEAHDRERTLLKPLLLDIIDVRDRLTAGLKPAVVPPPRWYERIRSHAKHQAEMAWREGVPTARRGSNARPTVSIATMDRRMGSNDKVHLAGTAYTPQEISAIILKRLKAIAEQNLRRPVHKAVITRRIDRLLAERFLPISPMRSVRQRARQAR